MEKWIGQAIEVAIQPVREAALATQHKVHVWNAAGQGEDADLTKSVATINVRTHDDRYVPQVNVARMPAGISVAYNYRVPRKGSRCDKHNLPGCGGNDISTIACSEVNSCMRCSSAPTVDSLVAPILRQDESTSATGREGDDAYKPMPPR